MTPNLHVVKVRLGHQDIRTTINTYGHMLPNVDAVLADAQGEMWDATATEPASNVVALDRAHEEEASKSSQNGTILDHGCWLTLQQHPAAVGSVPCRTLRCLLPSCAPCC